MNLIVKNKHKPYLHIKRLFDNINKKSIFTPIQNPNEKRKVFHRKLPVTDVEYYDIMKDFEKEAEGVPYGSEKHIKLRNKYYREVLLKSTDSILKGFVESGGANTESLRFYIIVIPESVECYQLINILNYNKLLYKAFEDSPLTKQILSSFLGYDFKKSYKSFNFPFLQMESSQESEHVKIDNYSKIIDFLIENEFIPEFRTFSASEKNGVEYSKKLNDLFDNQYLLFSNKFSFYSKTTNFKECEYGYNQSSSNLYMNRIKSKTRRLITYSLYDIFKYISNYANIRNKSKFKSDLELLLNEWIERLNLNPFHGGDVPDDADFKVYSVIRKFRNCNKMNNMINKVKTNLFSDWEAKMDLLCQRYNNNDSRDFAYVVNNLNSKEIQMETKIHKKVDTDLDLKGAFAGNKKRGKLNI